MSDVLNLQPLCKKKGRLIRNATEVKSSAIHGYGVFADQIIFPGEIIEECPLILLRFSPDISFHAFKWDEHVSCLPLGCGALYNHSIQPNARYEVDKENHLLRIIANTVIYRGDEIFINYGNDWFKNHNLHDLTDPNSTPLKSVELELLQEAHKTRRTRMGRVAILILLLVFTYLFTPTVSNSHVHSFPAVANVLQQLNSTHWESSSTVPHK